ncbi:hypothetical protein MKZ38_003715 [Zalerion maritima]|uniref:Uncharacterized protein n=1 Tax=Zalerion maritima TaxID=339359 RepID=A0AAD5RYR9_9PEZI|nr:hypothetical protein MKZ38_003715 [Zalerion maritima]
MYISFPTQVQPDKAARSVGSAQPGKLLAAATSVIRRGFAHILSAATTSARGPDGALSPHSSTLEPRSAVAFALDGADAHSNPGPRYIRSLVRRQMSEHQLRIVVGVTVAVLLTAFIAASCTFMYLYRPTVRYRRRRHHHHHHHHNSHKSSSRSRSSHGSGSIGKQPSPGPPPPPPPPPPADE